MKKELATPITLILVFLGLLIGLVVLSYISAMREMQGTLVPSARGTSIPQYTPSTAAKLAASRGFQHLVSYTDRGFEPMNLVVKKGETVRFTNNSGTLLWIASRGSVSSRVYPGNSSCGGSLLDSCTRIEWGDFWEFTFEEAGTWGVMNNVNKTASGTIVVR